MQVLFAGPFANFAFALAAFTAIWVTGGREKPFAETTGRIGVMDAQSALYQKGIRAGDEITEYNGRSFGGLRDLQVASLMDKRELRVQGYKVDPLTGEKTPFDETVPTYPDSRFQKGQVLTVGIQAPASYLIVQHPAGGFQAKDRLLWADGEMVYSAGQLSQIVNAPTTLLTVRRGEDVFLTRAPRVPVSELKLGAPERGELDDWQHDAHLKGKLSELAVVPYMLSPDCKVEGRLGFIDSQDQQRAFQPCERCTGFVPLEEGDRVLAVNGRAVKTPAEVLSEVQQRKVLVIVQRNNEFSALVSPKQADAQFGAYDHPTLDGIITSIGTDAPIVAAGDLHLLEPIQPKALGEFASAEQVAASRKAFDTIKDPKERALALSEFEAGQKRQVLGLQLADRPVRVNPNPFTQFGSVLADSGRTLAALFSGTLSPKYMSGPIGMVHAVQQSWNDGAKDALYWMAVISLSLGFLNLLPIPALDGGYILFSIWEIITKKRIQGKTMERLIVPFFGLMVILFLFTTYQDLARLFSWFF